MVRQHLNVLIADDDSGDRKLISRHIKLTQLRVDITEAVDVNQAINLLKDNQFDIAFIDYQMPGNLNLEGIERIHAQFPYTAIVLMTGQGDENVASTAIQLGALDYMTKRSISATNLMQTIERATRLISLQQQIDEQKESLSQFSRVLVHDLKGPIRHIKAFSEMINEASAQQHFDKIAEFSQIIIKSATRLDELIDALSAYNKTDVSDVRFDTVSMQKIVTEVVFLMHPEIEEKNANIVFSDLPEVKGNAPQLFQLMQNLIGNGLKYCDAEHPHISISVLKEKNQYRFCVEDNGIGFEDKFNERIFEPFQRLHSPNDKRFSGSGLGLSTCKKIVSRHGGDIRCQSELGKGSMFFFTLPFPIIDAL